MKIRHCLILSLLFLFFINTPAIGQERGWCCLDGEVKPIPEAECIERGGQFFNTREEAEKYCQGEQPKLEEGWCCLDGEVFQTSKDECLEREGYFFNDLIEAEQYCRDEHSHQAIPWVWIIGILIFITALGIGLYHFYKTRRQGKTGRNIKPTMKLKVQRDMGTQQIESDTPIQLDFEIRLKPVSDHGSQEIKEKDSLVNDKRREHE